MSTHIQEPTEPEERLPLPLSETAYLRFVWGFQAFKLGFALLGAALALSGRVSMLDLALCAGMYLLTMLGITAGFHRLFSHRSFEAHPALRAFLAAAGTMAGQGSALIWVATHRKHHQHGDQPGDPHSPHTGTGSLARRFWHAHVGWILADYPRQWERYVQDLIDDPMLVAMHQRAWMWIWVGLLLPAAIGGWLSGSWLGALSGMVWGGWVRMFLVEQSTCLVNSAGHLWGARPFDLRDRSVNSWPLAILALGDGWHHNHHAFPASARHGLRWWELDLTFGVIKLWQGLRLVERVNVPDAAQQAARRRSRSH